MTLSSDSLDLVCGRSSDRKRIVRGEGLRRFQKGVKAPEDPFRTNGRGGHVWTSHRERERVGPRFPTPLTDRPEFSPNGKWGKSYVDARLNGRALGKITRQLFDRVYSERILNIFTRAYLPGYRERAFGYFKFSYVRVICIRMYNIIPGWVNSIYQKHWTGGIPLLINMYIYGQLCYIKYSFITNIFISRC